MEVVDRLLGFDIYQVHVAPPWLPWTPMQSSVHATLMDERWVISVGPVEALEDLIEARVGGSSQPIRRRAGFDALAADRDRSGFWAHVDEGVLYDNLAHLLGLTERLPLTLRAALVEAVDGVTLRNAISHGDDRLDMRLHLKPAAASRWSRTAADAPSSRSHSLLRRMPIDPQLAWSVSLDTPDQVMTLIRSVTSLNSQLGPDPGAGPFPSGDVWSGLVAVVGELHARGELSGDALLAATEMAPGEATAHRGDWVAAVGLLSGDPAGSHSAEILELLARDGWTAGAVHSTVAPLHIARRGEESWYWRVSGGVLTASSSTRVLDLVGDWHPGPGSGGNERALGSSLRNIPTDAPVLVVLDPARFGEPLDSATTATALPEWNQILTADLRPEFRVAAAVDIQEDSVAIYANLGFWTTLSELAAAPVGTLDARTITALPSACREAYGVMCAERTTSPLCAAFLPGRSQVVARACARLKGRGLLTPPTGATSLSSP